MPRGHQPAWFACSASLVDGNVVDTQDIQRRTTASTASNASSPDRLEGVDNIGNSRPIDGKQVRDQDVSNGGQVSKAGTPSKAPQKAI